MGIPGLRLSLKVGNGLLAYCLVFFSYRYDKLPDEKVAQGMKVISGLRV